MKKWFPHAIVGVFALWFLAALIPPRDKSGQLALQAFGRLPVVSNGRVQPLDSLGRNSLLQLREKQTANAAPWESRPQILSGVEWLAEMMMKPDQADTRPVFRIDNPDLKGLLGLPMDADKEKKTDGKHFAWTQIRGKLEQLQTEARRVQPIDASKRTPFDQSVMRLWNGVGVYMRLQNTLQPQNAQNWEKELNTYLNNVPAGVAAARAQQANKEYDKEALDRIMRDLERFDTMKQLEPPLLIPPREAGAATSGWQRTGDALMNIARGDTPSIAISSYARMSSAYREGRIADFNQAVADYTQGLSATGFDKQLTKASREQYFNRIEPFYKAMYPYVLALVLVLVFWLNPIGFEPLRTTAVRLIILGLAVHTLGLLFRMFLEGRPPVTNLYSSAIFIGFGAVILGWVLEAFWRNGIGVVIASALGFVSLIIAHHLSLSGDTMEMLRAVLDTNFWLATHVVVVTLGYASTFVAGFLGLLYIILGVFTPNLRRPLNARAEAAGAAGKGGVETGKALVKMVYGIVCFATLFSFVGTVLGGIWADQSWGRFWGWDPKENGALIIVLWNALILHARWGGLVRERGLMNLAIVGNIVTSWSWFGVNMLGIGLHSYGFTDAAFLWLMAFVISQLGLIAIGSLPLRLWRSFRDEPPTLPQAEPEAVAA